MKIGKAAAAAAMLGFISQSFGLETPTASQGAITNYYLTVTNGINTKGTLGDAYRLYTLYIPRSYSSSTPAPLVIVMHGGSLDNSTVFNPSYQASVWTISMQDPTPVPGGGYKNPQSIADQYGIIVAAPNGFNPSKSNGGFLLSDEVQEDSGSSQAFNDCTGQTTGYWNNHKPFPQQVTVDDVAFIQQMVVDIEGNFNIDRKRIYSTGVSRGGMMSMRLAREAENRGTPFLLAAAAVAAGGDAAPPNKPTLQDNGCMYSSIDSNNNFTTSNEESHPVPVWMIKGDVDKYVTYNGGQTQTIFNPQTDWYMPYEPAASGNITTTPAGVSTIKLIWLRNGLGSNPSSSSDTYDDTTPGDGSVVSCTYYGSGTRSEIDDCIAANNGHIEPSFAVPATATVQAIVGNQNQDIDTATEEWKFFQRFVHP
jgi:poly(3-hydroxybutyrate) depolymerase